MEEIWKDIEDYYQVSTLGRIKSTKIGKERILKGSVNPYGYVCVSLSGKTRRVHQLVAIAFLNHKPRGLEMVVNHKNFIRHDNRLENLEIVTTRENTNQKHIKSTSDFVGVFWNKQTKKWQADIHINGRKKYLGSSDCELEASEYYQKALEGLRNGVEIDFKTRTRSSKYKGVSWSKKNKKWIARISVDGYRKYVGSFDAEEDAFKCCQKAIENIKIKQ